jgi:hypothetical protein
VSAERRPAELAHHLAYKLPQHLSHGNGADISTTGYNFTTLVGKLGSLESLVGKLGALALAAPGILIKLRRCYTALAGASRSPSTVLQVAGPLRDELRELASMPFWRTAVAPWVRPVHLTITVSESRRRDLMGTNIFFHTLKTFLNNVSFHL